MSKSIDNRVVEMQFDNNQFEQGVKTSVKSLDNLKKGLNLEQSTKSLQNLDRVGKSFSLSHISDGVNTIASRFTMLGIMGVTALQNITNAAVTAGINIAKALTIDPIFTGLSEYETKMNAIQTILTNTASKGTTLDQVNKALGELNNYADQTIYNFAEMTRNVGTFTAAGVDLNTSVTSIKGIANLAAASGSNAEQAATAMYQLSQAISTGTVRLMDWNSVVNAGMGGELFRVALEKTAKELGHGRDMALSFRDSLDSGWLTTEVLTKTLQNFANDPSLIKAATQVKTFTQLISTMKEAMQSGWAESWENIIGNQVEAVEFLTMLSDAFNSIAGKSAQARNEMLKFWKDNGGRADLIQAFVNMAQGVGSVIKPISEAFREIFPKMTAERLVEITKAFKDFTAQLKLSDENAAKLKTTFKAVFAVIKIVLEKMLTGVKIILAVGNSLTPLLTSFLNLTSIIGDYILRLYEVYDAMGVFDWILGKVCSTLDVLTGILTGSASSSGAFAGITAFVTSIADGFGKIADYIAEDIENFNVDKLYAVINGTIFGAVLLAVRKFISSLSGIAESAKGLLSGITSILDGVRESLKAWQAQLKANTLLKIALAVGVLAASLLILSTIDPEKMASSLQAMTMMFGELVGVMALLETVVAIPAFRSALTIPPLLIGISIAILILAGAMKKLAEINPEDINKGLRAIAGLAAVLVGSALALSKVSKPLMVGAVSFIFFAEAIVILTKAVQKLSEIEPEKLQRGLLGVAALCTALAIFMRTTDLSKMGFTTGTGLIFLATAMLILSQAVLRMGEVDHELLIRGLIALGVILGGLGIFITKIGSPKKLIATAVAITILGTAMLIFSQAVMRLGEMDHEALIRGLIAIGILLGEIFLFTKYMKVSLSGAASIFILAAALTLLAIPLASFGRMSLVNIGKSLLMLAGVFVIIGAAGAILTPIIPALIGLGVAIALVGLGCMAAGAGILLIAAGITALAVAAGAGSIAIVALVTALAGTLPIVMKQLGLGVLTFVEVIGEGAPALINAFVKLLSTLVDAIILVTPKIVEGFYKLLGYLLDAAVKYTPNLIKAGMKFLLAFLKGIADNISEVVAAAILIVINFVAGIASMLPQIVDAGFNLMVSFINGLAESIATNTPLVTDAMNNLANSLIYAFKYPLGLADDGEGIFSGIGRDVVNGFVNGIKSKIEEVRTWASNIGTTAVEATRYAIRSTSPSKAFTELGMYSSQGFALGLKDYAYLAENEAGNVGKTAMDALKRSIAKISDIVNADVNIAPTIRPVLDLRAVTSGAASINSMLSNNQGITVDSISSRTAAISNTMPQVPNAVANIMANNSIEKLLGDLKTAFDVNDQRVTLDGVLTVKGVNDMNQLVGVTKLFAQEFSWGNRRVPKRVATIPSRA